MFDQVGPFLKGFLKWATRILFVLIIVALLGGILFLSHNSKPVRTGKTIKEVKPITGTVSGKVVVPAQGDFKVTVPVQGEIKETGEKVTGETTIEKKDDTITAITHFEYKPPPEKLYEVGLYLVASNDGIGWGGYIERDFHLVNVGPVDVDCFGRVEVDNVDQRVMAGIKGKFPRAQ